MATRKEIFEQLDTELADITPEGIDYWLAKMPTLNRSESWWLILKKNAPITKKLLSSQDDKTTQYYANLQRLYLLETEPFGGHSENAWEEIRTLTQIIEREAKDKVETTLAAYENCVKEHAVV